jgi:hypothetical protein
LTIQSGLLYTQSSLPFCGDLIWEKKSFDDEVELEHNQTRDDERRGGRLAAVGPLSGRGDEARHLSGFVTF